MQSYSEFSAVSYRGIRFEQGVEARWAAFFDLAKWKWKYKPVKFGDWSPTFIINDRVIAVAENYHKIRQWRDTAHRIVRQIGLDDNGNLRRDVVLFGSCGPAGNECFDISWGSYLCSFQRLADFNPDRPEEFFTIGSLGKLTSGCLDFESYDKNTRSFGRMLFPAFSETISLLTSEVKTMWDISLGLIIAEQEK